MAGRLRGSETEHEGLSLIALCLGVAGDERLGWGFFRNSLVVRKCRKLSWNSFAERSSSFNFLKVSKGSLPIEKVRNFREFSRKGGGESKEGHFPDFFKTTA